MPQTFTDEQSTLVQVMPRADRQKSVIWANVDPDLGTIANSKYNAHTGPLFRRLNLLKVKDIFMLNILKMYHKFQKKVATSLHD